ncbi:MAG: DNA-3-methyladenine glycosylase [Acidobacteria bacterium]|nr:DNA-3-methyladenine glycosylase [Acidobacteriota bacterium]
MVETAAQIGVLPHGFYSRPTTEVARDLLGKVIVHQVDGEELAGKIVEVEAYLGLKDEAAHAFVGITPRTKVMFGPPGHAYVYLIYGMYHCLNLVTEPDGEAGCVLIRALEPVAGIEAMQAHRPKARRPHDIASGPGKLTRAIGITLAHYGADVTRGALTVREDAGASLFEIGTSPRIGIKKCVDWPLRFFVKGNAHVSKGG